MRIDVKFGTTTHAVEVPESEAATATLGRLKELIRDATGVLPAMQKLLGKPGLQTKPDDTPLAFLGIKDKTKLMLIGSTAAEVVQANAPTTQAEKETEDKQEQLMRSLPYNFWAFAPFAGLLADPFVENKGQPLEGGSALMAMLSLDMILSRINTLGASAANPFASSTRLLTALGQEASEQVSHRFLKSLTTAQRTAIQKAHAVLRSCFRFTMEATESKFPDSVLGAVDRTAQLIEGLPVGEWLMLPGGWLGMRSHNIFFFLVHRRAPEVLDVVVVNKGREGHEYHPSWQTADRIRSCAVLRFDNVAKERLLDRTFWLLNYALWMNRENPGDRSEFVRAEVVYDVLLPWLVEKDPSNEQVKRYATEMLLGGGSSITSSGCDAAAGNQEAVQAATASLPASRREGEAHQQQQQQQQGQPFSPFVMEHGGSVPCSASSAIKSATAAFCFLLEQYGGMGREDIRQMKYALKYEYLLRATEDLTQCAERFLLTPQQTTTRAAAAASSSSGGASGKASALAQAVATLRGVAGVRASDKSTVVTIQQILSEVQRRNLSVRTAQNVALEPGHFSNKMVVMYTGTLAVPGVRKFATLFADTAAAITRRATASTAAVAGAAVPPVEFLMLSCDQTRETYEEHAAMFSFPRVSAACQELFQDLDIRRAPEVFVFMPDGTLLHRHGVRAVREDPDAEQFPGGVWQGAVPLSATDVKMLQIGAAQVAHHTKRRRECGALTDDDVAHVVELVQGVRGVVAAMPKDNVHTLTRAKQPANSGEKDEQLAPRADSGAAAAQGADEGDDNSDGDAFASVMMDSAVNELNAMLSQPLTISEAAEFGHASLLPTASVAQYYGKPYRISVPALKTSGGFPPVRSYAALFKCMVDAREVVESLWKRAGHSGTASRVAVQMQIIEFITCVFSLAVPVPFHPGSASAVAIPDEEQSCVSAFYFSDGPDGSFSAPPGAAAAGEGTDMQLSIMETIHYMTLSFANAWQAVENPSRSFDAERCLVAMHMMLVFDAVARRTAGAHSAQGLAALLCADGGYFPSTTLGKQTIPFARVAGTLELTRPGLLPLRSGVLRHIQYQAENARHELFDLRMPDKLELRKASTTVTFLRTFLDNCGYSLEESGSMMGQNASEMEKLMEWLCSARSPLAREHPEFGMYRDMVLLAKFLGTLEMRDAQLLHRRKELDPLASWRLSFEEDAPGRQMSAGWRTRPAPPKWECVMVRGRDMDIADIIVKGFGDREVMYGEGLTLQSPIDVSRLIETDHPTEDDVLHAKSMPNFGGTMSPEEAEIVLSCLTTPYVRIPLILDFFSSQDRNTYLFVREVQEVLRAVLFEPAAYVTPEKLQSADPRSVPMRLNAQQRAEIELRILRGDRSRQDYEECLGTTYGLLLNEIAHAPTAVLNPIRRILSSVTELGPSSVYSANASYVLYVVGLVCDVMEFCRYVVEKGLSAQQPLVEAYHNEILRFMHEQVTPLMRGWLFESEANSDTPTQCVIYAYKGMVDRAMWKGMCSISSFTLEKAEGEGKEEEEGEVSTPAGADGPRRAAMVEEQIVRLLQDCSFVRARHGFGMGMQRTQLAAQEGDNLLTPEEKMLRFLQAQGLDTSNISQQVLEQGRQLMMSGGRRRAVFVQIRSRFYNDTVRVPNLFHSDPTSTTESKALKLPPADVPENVLFAHLLQDGDVITRFLDEQTPERRGVIFQKVVQAVLCDHAAAQAGVNDDDEDDASSQGHGGSAPVSPVPGAGFGLARRRGSLTRSPSAASARVSTVHLDQMASTEDITGAEAVERWEIASHGVYRGPASSGLLFHAETCELFWRNDELKPVPDSMSHFTDFENVLGKEMLQCGLVSRHENRHWVHIVGTPYDVIEWSAPMDLADQGVHSPVILDGKLPEEPVMSCVFEEIVYDRPVAIDDEDPWPVKGERWAVEMVRQVLQRAFAGGIKFSPLARALPSAAGSSADDEEGTASRAAAAAGGKVHGDEGEVEEMHFIMNDAPQYEGEEDRATWKEIVCYRYPQPHFSLFNLVPHARKLYRSLVFSTNQRFCLHSLGLLSQPRTRETLAVSAYQAGELKRRVQRESTLEIHRFNDLVNGREVYVPARLLQGLIPSALLESFFFWQGEDDVIRGYPLSSESSEASILPHQGDGQGASSTGSSKEGVQPDDADGHKGSRGGKGQNADMLDHWFNYAVELYMGGARGKVKQHVGATPEMVTAAALTTGSIAVVRREDKTYTPIHPKRKRRQVSGSRKTTAASHKSAAMLDGATRPGEEAEDEEVVMKRVMRESEVALLHAAIAHVPRGACGEILSSCDGDVAAAIQWVTDPANQDALNELVRADLAAEEAAAEEESAATQEKKESHRHPHPPQHDTRDDRVLVHLMRCKALRPFLETLTSLEDPSHILVWGRRANDNSVAAQQHVKSAASADSGIVIDTIEMPRLRARFYAKADGTDSRLRLFLADQPGWRVAEVDDILSTAQRRRLRELRDPFQQCLVLANSAHEVAFMVPNHDFTAMQVEGDPFNALLLFDRSSYTWRESVPSPYYLYAVHTSHAYLVPPTLSASLYYAVVQCATQHYSGALRTLESCYADSPFSPEEAFMFALFERTVPDAYPDAHAVRLKLAHAVQYSTNKYQWPLHLEVHGYLRKLRHISADCRLRRGEVLDLLKRCSEAVPLVRSQLELYHGLLRNAGSGGTATADVVVKTPALERCGFPWERLLLYPWDRISPQKLKRVTYAAPQPDALSEGKLVEFIFKDELLLDEESGANAKKGFYFLYSIKKGDLKATLFGKNASVSFSQLMVRWFHLRHARWGREAQQSGETEASPSWCATVLQLMELFPTAEWPAPVSPNERFMMARGLNLVPGTPSAQMNWDEDRVERRTRVPDVFNKMNSVARELFNVSSITAALRVARSASQKRTPDQRHTTVHMWDHIVPRVLPSDTAMGTVRLSESALSIAYFGGDAGQRHKTLTALCSEPLRELGFVEDGIIAVTEPTEATSEAASKRAKYTHPTDGGSSGPGDAGSGSGSTGGATGLLPFDIRHHPLARAPLAQNMLDRLEEDSARFADQQQGTTKFTFSSLEKDRVRCILAGTAATDVSGALLTAMSALATCEKKLFSMARRDAGTLARLSKSVLGLANSLGEHSTAGLSSAAEAKKKDPAFLAHCLELTSRGRVPVTMEWLCGGLLSTSLESELASVNPFHGSVAQLRTELVALMLLGNRSFFAEQSAMAVRNVSLFLEFCCLIRNIPRPAPGGETAPSSQQSHDSSSPSRESRRRRIMELVQHFSLEIEPSVLETLMKKTDESPGRTPAGSMSTIPKAVVDMLIGRAEQMTSAALDLITARRFYTNVTDNKPGHFTFELDPRFLLFEFMFNILLRARQVEMVRWFVANINEGQSRVQQMIMGQGKTTVVGPLLALILADGTQLVTQVMPTALLEQTRSILRRCFGVVVVKHIYSLQFDRSFEDSGDGGVELVYQKLKAAEEDRSVVIAAPECIKSLFLKSIEQMHVIETVSTADLNQELSTDERYATHAAALRKKTIERSAMADAITPILQIWKRGVLIMDEVDVLLHPLRSELNFPIGLKHPIDMSGHRWLLPIHLLDAIFFHQRGRACQDVQHLLRLATSSLANVTAPSTEDTASAGGSSDDDGAQKGNREGRVQTEPERRRANALAGVKAAIAQGFATRALQREPHLVLLDVGYYESVLLPALVPWLQMWLHEQILERMSASERAAFPLRSFTVFAERTSPFLSEASKEGEGGSSPVAAFINTHFSGFGIKLLNLAHDWLHRLLPHVLSKIDRVSFGVLQPSDLATVSASAASSAGSAGDVAKMPYSRRMMAVPFVAKDVPSRSSEFAHPDVVIGLTVLAFRYEGLRKSDIKELVTQLKQDFARQAGPKEHRPAAKLYRRWLQLSAEDANGASARSASSGAGQPTSHRMRLRTMSVRDLQEAAGAAAAGGGVGGGAGDDHAALGLQLEGAGVPLSQLQVTDRAQLESLHRLLHCVPEVVHYYLCSCVFPRTMNFQNLKVSACGHELGSSMLFTQRIGFSGTPSNLLPLDLGECFYEPGSDGRVLSVLTNPNVASAEVLPDSWTPLKVLDRIAAAQPPLYALIDAGALITNMDNEDVARYLLQRLPASLFDGVVFLDSRDRQMIIQRDNGLIVPVAQCGVPLSRRFSFFDQVHTTGTDVKQSATATAVITLGKDLVFRDYAQGAYRMRGIGKGQRLCLYLIPEVISRIHEVLGPFKTGDLLRDVPAWLLLNSMKVEGLQFFKLSLQELANVWRKKALRNLLRDSVYALTHDDLFTGYLRSRRFHMDRPVSQFTRDSTREEEARHVAEKLKKVSGGAEKLTEFEEIADVASLPDVAMLRCSIQEFRETIEYPIAARVEAPKPFLTHLQELVEERPKELIENDAHSTELVEQLLDRMRRSVQAAKNAQQEAAAAGGGGTGGEHAHQTMDLNAEIVHEQEAEEEQEQEAEQEEQRVSAFSRDDEFQVPWQVDTLRVCGADASATERPTDGCCFYQINRFQIRPSQPQLVVDPKMLLSDNYFRVDWHGVGERRLKGAFLFVEWIPNLHTSNEEGAESATDHSHEICSGLITLAEGESLRWLLHNSSHVAAHVAAALRFVSTGRYMDASPIFSSAVHRSGVVGLRQLLPLRSEGGKNLLSLVEGTPAPEGCDNTSATTPGVGAGAVAAASSSPDRAALLFRFYNNDMFFSEAQLRVLEDVLRDVPPEDRLQFFVECLRVRRRHRNHWEDAPIAALFVAPDDRAYLKQLSLINRVQLSLTETLELLVEAGKPRRKSKVRREAEQARAQLEVFTEGITSNYTALLSQQAASNEEEKRLKMKTTPTAEDGGAALPIRVVALLMLEAFPRLLSGFSAYDVEQALKFAVARQSTPTEKASTQTGVVSPTMYEEVEGRQAMTLAELYRLFPALDLHHVQQCVAAGTATLTGGPNEEAGEEGSPASPSPAPSGVVAEEEQVEVSWSCEACTYLNDASSRVCAICMTGRPASATASAAAVTATGSPTGPTTAAASARPHADHDDDDDDDEDEDGPWQCETCTFINESRSLPVCAVCLANNPNPLKEKGGGQGAGGAGSTSPPPFGDMSWDCPEGYWVCSVEHGGCSKFNPNNVFYCQVCEKARPNLASVRF